MKLPSLYLLLFPTHSVSSPGGVGPALEGVRFLSRRNVCPLPYPPDTENFRSICVCADVVSVEKFEKFSRVKSRVFRSFLGRLRERVRTVSRRRRVKLYGLAGSYGAGRAVSGSGDAGGGI